MSTEDIARGNVETLARSLRERLSEMLRSIDWSVVPAWERPFGEALFDEVDHFADRIVRDVNHLQARFTEYEVRLHGYKRKREIEVTAEGTKLDRRVKKPAKPKERV